MPVTRAQAKEICTKPEFELVEASFRPAVTSLTPSQLRSKVERTRKLQDKFRELSHKQNRETKESQPARGRAANQRTEKKAKLFVETRERFEKRLAELDAKEAGATGAGTSRRARAAGAAAENRRTRRQAKQDLRPDGTR